MITYESTITSEYQLTYKFKGAPDTNVWVVYVQPSGNATATENMQSYLDTLVPFMEWYEVVRKRGYCVRFKNGCRSLTFDTYIQAMEHMTDTTEKFGDEPKWVEPCFYERNIVRYYVEK